MLLGANGLPARPAECPRANACFSDAWARGLRPRRARGCARAPIWYSCSRTFASFQRFFLTDLTRLFGDNALVAPKLVSDRRQRRLQHTFRTPMNLNAFWSSKSTECVPRRVRKSGCSVGQWRRTPTPRCVRGKTYQRSSFPARTTACLSCRTPTYSRTRAAWSAVEISYSPHCWLT